MDPNLYSDKDLIRVLMFTENRLTSKGLDRHKTYQSLLCEAIRRGLRQENLSEEQLLVRIEIEGPGFDR